VSGLSEKIMKMDSISYPDWMGLDCLSLRIIRKRRRASYLNQTRMDYLTLYKIHEEKYLLS
jgi:hypothetical protein